MSNDSPLPTVGPADAHHRAEGGAVLLDVREPDEWNAGHAPEATWIPMGEVLARQHELPPGSPIVVVCRMGGRSARVTSALLAAGYDATNVAGGMQAWAAADLPIVTDSGGPGTVT